MATTLLKKFPTIPVIALNEEIHIDKDGISVSRQDATFLIVICHCDATLGEVERHRLEARDYQKDKVNANSLWTIENCCLVDEIEEPLRSIKVF